MADYSKRRQRQVIAGWFRTRKFCHFDAPLSFQRAFGYVSVPSNIEQHAFLPFIEFSIVTRRFTCPSGSEHPIPSRKVRRLSVPSHVDGYIYARYAQELRQRYELFILQSGIDGSVLGDRTGRGDIPSMAKDAFADIAGRGDCLVVSIDVKDFFPSISHSELKRNWARILRTPTLPKDHYKVFRALTKSASICQQKCHSALGIHPGRRPYPWKLCTMAEFRKLRDLITVNDTGFGIPQGSQMTGIVANLSLLAFDEKMHIFVNSLGGSYRRYYDDILLTLDAENSKERIISAVESNLRVSGENLAINREKTHVVRFRRLDDGTLKSDHPSGIQYLGFTFDGKRVLIRSKTLARQQRRLVYAVRKAKKAALETGSKVFRRSIYRRFSYLGHASFISDYIKRAEELMPGNGIRRQFRKYQRRLRRILQSD